VLVVLGIIGLAMTVGGGGDDQTASTEPPAEAEAATTGAVAEADTTVASVGTDAPVGTEAPADSEVTDEVATVAALGPTEGCYGSSITPTSVIFVNNGTEPIDLFYRDENCDDIPWDTVEPGASRDGEETFVGDYWEVRVQNSDEVLKTFRSTDAPSVVVVPSADTCPRTPGGAVTLTVVNNGDEPANVYWVREDCTEELWGVVNPGETITPATVDGEVWSVRRAADAEQLALHVAAPDDDLVEVP
jgi:hypothetical protein